MFSVKLFGPKKERRTIRANRQDVVNEQVKKVLADSDQKIILMVRS